MVTARRSRPTGGATWSVPADGSPPYRAGQAPASGAWGADSGVGSGPGTRDSTTRYLCAAAHLDAGFADAAILECLVERTRAVASSPGVDAAAVLREAVAARTRRKIRDGTVLGLVVLFLLTNGLSFQVVSTLLLPGIWLLFAVVGRVLGVGRRGWNAIAVVVTAGIALGSVVVVQWLGFGEVSLLALLVGGLLVGTLLLDECAVDELTRHHFRPEWFRADPNRLPSGWVRRMRTLGLGGWAESLARVADADRQGPLGAGYAELVVHRGKTPFVGSGPIVKNQTLPLPLRPDDDRETDDPRPFAASELIEHVTGEILTLRDSGSLSPGQRLSGLGAREQVFVSAERLLRDRGHDLLPSVLPDLNAPPQTWMSLGRARRLADTPVEAARPYRCYRVEAWDRDLATSTYLNAGTDERMLYVEWAHCVLFPIKKRFRSIDHPQVGGGPVRRGLYAAVVFPLTIPARVASLCHRFQPIRQRHGEIVPDRYGAGSSLREMASDVAASTYFQEGDVVRYIKIVEQTMFRAISDFLAERGYSIAEVLDVAQSNITQVVLNNSTITDSAVGIGRVQRSGPTGDARRAATQKGTP